MGRLEPAEAEGDVLAYLRRARAGESDFLVVLNLGGRSQLLRAPADFPGGTIALSTHPGGTGERVGGNLHLRPDEAMVVRLLR